MASKRSILSESGMSGLQFSTGVIDEEQDPRLRGKGLVTVMRDMSDNDPTVGAIVFAITQLLRQVKWDVIEAEGGSSEEDAIFLRENLGDMSHSWADFVAEIFSMVIYGYSLFEICYKVRGGSKGKHSSRYSDKKYGWRKLAVRSQDSVDRWEFDKKGGLLGVIQKPPPDYRDIRIPIEKLLLFRTTTYKSNPEGRSLLRNAFRPWRFKKRIEAVEGLGIERDLAGLPVAKIPPEFLRDDATATQVQIRTAIETVLKNVRQDEQAGILWPLAYDEDGNEMFQLELMNSGGARTFATTDIIQRYDQRIAQVVLADFILLGHEKVGSFALSSDKTDVFAVALGALLDHVEDTINRFAIPRLWEINGMSTENMPTVKHGDIERPNLTELSQFLTSLGQAGMPLFPDANLEAYLRTAAGLPDPTEDAQEMAEVRQMQELEEMMAQQGNAGAPAPAPAPGSQSAPPPGTSQPQPPSRAVDLGADEPAFGPAQ